MEDIEEIDPDLYHDVSDRTLLQVREATVADDNLMTLAEMVTYGWPDDKSQVPPNVREYWPYRDELAVQRGILHSGTLVIVPTAIRQDMLTKIHLHIVEQMNASKQLVTLYIGYQYIMTLNTSVKTALHVKK